ncbi:hypothetical protein [uncultured Mucilaginibacter sp.]|uniref:hypothetical protein n=1 Tax=uncultured Mucilaginibacter sp. TaxID=797541 RepID=UPI0025F4462A|nr:hypothetical protein [uncultured Mucilaginibacter sp.]
MRHFKVTIFLIAFVNISLFAQSNLKFKKLILVEYDVKGEGKTQSIIVTGYREISDHKVHVVTKLYDGISDTTYQFPDSMAARLNYIFSGQKTIRSFMKTDRKLEGHYAGKPFFISCTHQDNTVENVIIETPYLDEDDYKKFDLLFWLRFGYNVKEKGYSIKGTKLEATILKYHKECNYLIKVEEPPTEMSLGGPPNGKN